MSRKADVAEVASRRYWRETDARAMVEAWRSSGDTLAGFTRRHGVKLKRLARWVTRLERTGEAPLHFHPVRLVQSRSASGAAAGIEIQLTGGQCVRLPRGFESEDLRRVLRVLAEGAARC